MSLCLDSFVFVCVRGFDSRFGIGSGKNSQILLFFEIINVLSLFEILLMYHFFETQ